MLLLICRVIILILFSFKLLSPYEQSKKLVDIAVRHYVTTHTILVIGIDVMYAIYSH